MLFHTWTFVLLFALVYSVYLTLRNSCLRLPWLLVASYVFYGWWNPLYLALILVSTSADYLAVLGMSRGRRRKAWLLLSVLVNLGMLGFFKYGGFVTASVNTLLARLGLAYAIPAPGVLLPVGISFYVFQSMSYTFDCYRGRMERETCFVRYATFVSLFPQLVAGPIERARNLLPQLRERPGISRGDVSDGLSLFAVGLFKKVVLADYLALYVDRVYGAPAQFEAPALILATFLFGWQIYFDFNGYTDMARGVARMMGIRLMLNFNNPYVATGLGDFWNRWHVSLSTWFRDYVYVPLGGNRGGTFATYRNMCLTMLVSGLWHGANWTFVLWGAVHALGRVLTRRLERTRFYTRRVPRVVKILWVFAFVTGAWIFFRAGTIGDAWLILRRIAAFRWADPRCPLVALLLVGSVWAYQAVHESRLRWLLELAPVRVALLVGMVVVVAVFAPSGARPFIYFQF